MKERMTDNNTHNTRCLQNHLSILLFTLTLPPIHPHIPNRILSTAPDTTGLETYPKIHHRDGPSLLTLPPYTINYNFIHNFLDCLHTLK